MERGRKKFVYQKIDLNKDTQHSSEVEDDKEDDLSVKVTRRFGGKDLEKKKTKLR